ncbi:uncharacterized protein METZ01_LOCUS386440 [marine metagenome]|jgi:flagellar biosynthesis/type III secretory pathway protein FliH|uniref:Essential protein Yae1 N-terminal domain-containing protein n=1 Tax=marine metagenome TaxID=408172 RepID=A0A382UH41_9ZZZZ
MDYLYLGIYFTLGVIAGWVIGQWKKNEHKIKMAEQTRKEGYKQGRDEGRADGWSDGWNHALNDMSNWCKNQARKSKK